MTSFNISTPQTTSAAPCSPALELRVERPDDAEWIETLQQNCFGPGRFARAAFRVRERFGVKAELCVVASLDGTPMANVKMSPIHIAGHNGFLLGPLATDPNRRKMGAGKLLVKTVVQKAFENQSCAFVLLVGDAPYYQPLGFAPTLPNKITFPAPVDPERVLVSLKEPAMIGQLKGPISKWI